MSLKDKKQKVFGEIAAARTLTSGMPNLKNTNSFPSINNGSDSILFLTDLLKSLVGQKEFVNVITETLTNKLGKIELSIKTTLKTVLRGLLSCGVNPSIPNFLKSTGGGVVINVSKIDFFDQLKTNPNSTAGVLMYNDITPILTNSNDFNTFLYGVIQDSPVTHTWKGMLDFKFEQNGTGTNPNNSLIIKVNPAYDNKSINDLNDNYIDSLTIVDTKNIVNKVIDLLFGSITVTNNKTRKQLEKEAEINDIIDRLISSDINDEINNDYFKFNNSEIAKQQTVADTRKEGIVKLKTSTDIDTTIDIGFLSSFTESYSQTTNLVEQRTLLNQTINNMADEIGSQSTNPQDQQTIKTAFVLDIIKNLNKSIINILISPKIITIFIINFKILYGLDAEYVDAKDFIDKNRLIFTSVFKTIQQEIIKLLMSYAMKEITRLAAQSQLVKLNELIVNRKQQLLSLTGVPQEALRRIKGLI
jgi:hypothetical protein